jgi:hypothetical protein
LILRGRGLPLSNERIVKTWHAKDVWVQYEK